jgi:O-methyltransferase
MVKIILKLYTIVHQYMKTSIKYSFKKLLAPFLYNLSDVGYLEPEYEQEFRRIYLDSCSYTYTPVERIFSLYNAVRYVVEAKIPGDLAECGVWRGGNCMVMAYTLMSLGETNRKIYIYDTFTGMSKPTEKDYSPVSKQSGISHWKKLQRDGYTDWCYSPLEEVQANLAKTGYPEKNLIFVKGKVEKTIPKTAPKNLALLRLDTDWYESTKHEMIHLYPRLTKKGVLIIDDYGHWAGARKAVDEYMEKNKIRILLNRVDYTCRIAVKI